MKVGAAIITCDRPDFFRQCLNSVPRDAVNFLVVIDDGVNKIHPDSIPKDIDYIYVRTVPARGGVGRAKHTAIEVLLNLGCDQLFLIEDDIVIKHPSVFDAYIEASQVTGIQHFMFGYHGPANKAGISHGEPKPKYRISYKSKTGKNIVIAINQHCVGAFCYYTKKCFDEVGNFDLDYMNAFEHIDHSHMIAKAGLTTPYWNWADIDDSIQYLDELACSEESSAIRGEKDWQPNIQKGLHHFYSKHGEFPWGPQGVTDVSFGEVKEILKDIYEKYSDRN